MSTSKEYMQFVLDQLKEFPDVTYRKMFGEYMVYLQGRPVLLVCDNCAMVKKLPELAELMRGAPDGLPYEGARVHSVLDLEDRELVRQVMDILLRVSGESDCAGRKKPLQSPEPVISYEYPIE